MAALITQRSQVQILAPLPYEKPEWPCAVWAFSFVLKSQDLKGDSQLIKLNGIKNWPMSDFYEEKTRRIGRRVVVNAATSRHKRKPPNPSPATTWKARMALCRSGFFICMGETGFEVSSDKIIIERSQKLTWCQVQEREVLGRSECPTRREAERLARDWTKGGINPGPKPDIFGNIPNSGNSPINSASALKSNMKTVFMKFVLVRSMLWRMIWKLRRSWRIRVVGDLGWSWFWRRILGRRRGFWGCARCFRIALLRLVLRFLGDRGRTSKKKNLAGSDSPRALPAELVFEMLLLWIIMQRGGGARSRETRSCILSLLNGFHLTC